MLKMRIANISKNEGNMGRSSSEPTQRYDRSARRKMFSSVSSPK
jgi:hypothetical protein